MSQSPSIKEIGIALAKANNELSNPVFDSKNPHFKNNYASLACVRNTIIPILAKYGLSILQLPKNEKDGLVLETMLIHESGEYISSEFFLPVVKKDAQGYGSALTYARRYALQAIVCVVGDEDDDAEVSVKNPTINEINAQFKTVKKQIEDCIDIDELKSIYCKAYNSGFSEAQLKELTLLKDEVKNEIVKQSNQIEVLQNVS
jgi:ERF superfamily